MTDQECLTISRQISDPIDDITIKLGTDTVREDVLGWDSFNYIAFIVAVEVEYGIKFRTADVESFPDVGAIVAAIDARQSVDHFQRGSAG